MKLLYFAWVRERIGKSEDNIALPKTIGTINQLGDYLETLDEGYVNAFKIRDKVKVALNQNHVDWDHPICDTDEIAFFPPVTGG
jgi:sulfur-carrier protein